MNTFLISLLSIYCLIMLGMFVMQRKIMFIPDRASLNPEAFGIPRLTKQRLVTSDNVSITAWYKQAENNKPTVLYFHGNAFHLGAEYRLSRFNHIINEGYGLLAISYRGYGDSDGNPSEQGLYEDGRAGFAFLQEQSISHDRVIILGESMGSGVATHMAVEHKVGAVILDSPYTSTVDVGAADYWWLPVHLLLLDKFESWKKIGRVTSPITIIHGDADDTIPVSHGERLFSLANEPKKLTILKGVSHVDAHPDIIMQELNRLTSEYL
jgi:fermentation-respiration switch protein FrsA (DUF1100 family)